MINQKSKYALYFGWAFVNGLILGILIAHGQDISETGIASTILRAINEGIPISGYIGLQILLWIIGIGSTVYQAYQIWQDGIGTTIMAISCFLGIFLLIIGTAFNIEAIQTLGLFLFIISFFIRYVIHKL